MLDRLCSSRRFRIGDGGRRAPIILVALLAVGVTLSGGVATASGSCASSTGGNASITDPTGDTTGADILRVDVALDGVCGIKLEPVLDSSRDAGLTADDEVVTYINTDGNPATGDTSAGGVDRAVVARVGVSPTLFSCTTTPCELNEVAALSAVGAAGFTTDLNQLGVASPTTLGITVSALYRPSDTALWDRDDAPDNLPPYDFPVSFASVVEPPPPPGPFTPSVSFPAIARPKCLRRDCLTTCIVPRIKGKRVSRAKKALQRAGCKYRILGRGRVVSVRPKAGTKTSRRVQVRAKRKRTQHSRVKGHPCSDEQSRRRCSRRPCRSRSCYKDKCTVPNVKGKSVSDAKKALEKAGCEYKITGSGRVVSTSPPAGTETRKTVQVKAAPS